MYINFPYKGCTKRPRCLFCGVQDSPDPSLVINQDFGNEAFAHTKQAVNQAQPDSLVLYNGGNILRPAEMYQPTIIKDIPNFVAHHPYCNIYEIEARADDIPKFKESIRAIQQNLKQKQLRIRIGIEFFDDKELKKHKKGINTAQIQQAVNVLREMGIEWNGYVLLGGARDG